MILDAATMAKMIRATAIKIKNKNKNVAIEPAKSIQALLEELAQSFDSITNQAQEEKPVP